MVGLSMASMFDFHSSIKLLPSCNPHLVCGLESRSVHHQFKVVIARCQGWHCFHCCLSSIVAYLSMTMFPFSMYMLHYSLYTMILCTLISKIVRLSMTSSYMWPCFQVAVFSPHCAWSAILKLVWDKYMLDAYHLIRGQKENHSRFIWILIAWHLNMWWLWQVRVVSC